MKKMALALLLTFFCLTGSCQCTLEEPLQLPEKIQQEEAPPPEEEIILDDQNKPPFDNYKIALYTPWYNKYTVWEEAFFTAKFALERYPDNIIHTTIPESFDYVLSRYYDDTPYDEKKEEEIISLCLMTGLDMIKDPEVKVFIVNQFDSPTLQNLTFKLFTEIRKQRPDILVVALDCYTTTIFDLATVEEVSTLCNLADLLVSIDEMEMCKQMVKQAQKLGAETIFFYYWKRWLDYDINITKYEMVKQTCQELGLKFVSLDMEIVAGPIPVARLDLPNQVRNYGKHTNFICPDDLYYQPLIGVALLTGAICAQPWYPDMGQFFGDSMLGGESAWFKIDEDNANDIDLWIEDIKEKVAKKDGAGRASTWRVPPAMLATTAAVEYAIAYCEGKTQGKVDIEVMRDCFSKGMEIYNAAGTGFELNRHPDYGNHFLFTEDYIVF